MKILRLIIILFVLISCNKTETEDIEIDVYIPNNSGNSTTDITIIKDEFQNKKIVIAGNANYQFIVSFERELDGTLLEFSQSEIGIPIIMTDNEGNEWDIFGFAILGPRKGQRLKPTQSLIGYWFSFATFYPGIEIFPDTDRRGEFDGEKIEGSGNWLVPIDEIRSGGVGKDGIPALTNPKYNRAYSVEYLSTSDLVVGVSEGENQIAYPHDVLDWHEIINDGLGEQEYSIIYCPLTGTATAWNRNLNGKLTTFGVSGLLFNTNIVPFDRETDSAWSQLFDSSIFDELKGTKPDNLMVVETTWETWKIMFPQSNVVNFDTGYNRKYGDYPYGEYKTQDYLIFPVKYDDNRLNPKERVHAVVINGKARVYRFSNF